MKLSIVTINYNDAVGLQKTLMSVANQIIDCRLKIEDFQLEHIIVDGGSTDGSVDVIKDYESSITNHQSSIQLKWISEKDKGIYDAMNKGVRMAIDGKADYIQILNSGDRLYSYSVITDMYQALSESRESRGQWPGIVYGNMIRDFGESRGERRESRDKCLGQHEWTMLDFIKGTINHDPTWIRRDLYEKYGLYDPELKICSDWKWFVNAVIIGRGASGESVGTVQPVYVPIDVTLFDVTGISETQLEKRETERWNEIRKLLPPGVVRDYELYTFPLHQVARLKKYHLWPLVYFMERVLFKLEKWNILK